MQAELLRKKYPRGTKIILYKMNDPFPIPSLTRGVVDYVDDGGVIHVLWENGSSLGIIEGDDQFEVIKERD